MPLAVRYVEPQDMCQMPLLEAVSADHLRALGVQSLTSVIRQLGSLAKHAESIMGDIVEVVCSYQARTMALEERTRKLKHEILPTLDPDREGEKSAAVVQ